ncbi:uncharacterized protein I303_105162 [Kwoniella dejecticola CBS 10117]|uniref:Uncharacterized protein n=1 Tax=Kwoniella dejecticola CBS 10117 TaxID=1296121 RepID=A0A1A6A395_9TREE|nr:uncharacterized protein I303_05392 [Kwoniella dejecticola CBS 10117]OBR84533.1 hypothetical protein I303_05392 [Kwoniella dejecticola CBS 10117]
MGIFDFLRRRSSSFKATLRPVKSNTTTTTQSQSQSRYSSAPTSRCTSPINQTRSDELISIISRSIIYPLQSPSPNISPLSPPNSNMETARSGYFDIDVEGQVQLQAKASKDKKKNERRARADKDRKNGTAPEGFSAFLAKSKLENPNYRDKKLEILKPISPNDRYGISMQRKRNTYVDE